MLDVEVLVAHVVDLDGDVAPGPEERVGGWVGEVVEGVHAVGDGLESLLPSYRNQELLRLGGGGGGWRY